MLMQPIAVWAESGTGQAPLSTIRKRLAEGSPCVPGALHEFRKAGYGKRLGQSGGKLLTSFPGSTYVLCAIAVGHYKGS